MFNLYLEKIRLDTELPARGQQNAKKVSCPVSRQPADANNSWVQNNQPRQLSCLRSNCEGVVKIKPTTTGLKACLEQLVISVRWYG